MKCYDCGAIIPPERIEVMPDTRFCVKCVDKHIPPVVARMIYAHKTAGDIVIARGKENIRLLDRGYARSR